MGMLKKAREALQEATWTLKWKIRVELADPLGKAFYGCLTLLVVLHVPLLVAGIARVVADERGVASPPWTKGVFAFYLIIWLSFFAVNQGIGDANSSPPAIDEPVIQMVYEIQDQQMSEEEVERLAGAATAVMDTGMTAMEVAVDMEEERKKLRGEGEEDG
jgi:hypothetical protein